MGPNSGKMKLLSAVILVGLLMSFLGTPLNRGTNHPSDIMTTGNQAKSPNTAAFDLDADYLQNYLDSVIYRLYNSSRDAANTEFGLENTYFHLMANNWSNVVGGDTDKYSYDNILAYLGPWAMKLGQQGLYIKAGTFPWFNLSVISTPLYHQFNDTAIAGSSGAFRQKMNQNGTSVDDSFLMLDNALALLALLEFGGPLADEDAGAICLFLSNYLANTLWQPNLDDPNYSYFAPANGTNLGMDGLTFYTLLGAYTESMVAHSGVPSLAGFPAATIAQLALNAVNRSGIFAGLGGYPSDYTFRESPSAFHQISTLKTNALGIATLADFYIRSGRQDANTLTQAEGLYQTVIDHFSNNTFSSQGAFMDDIDDIGHGISVQTSLGGNSYWILALARLFEATGNISYYQEGIKVYKQVVANLWDSNSLGFNRTMGYFNNDTTKSVGDNAIFYFALEALDNAYWQTQFTVVQPPPDCVIQANPILNFTCQYNLTWIRDFSNVISYYDEAQGMNVGLNYTINQPIAFSNVSFSIRYHTNGTLITQIQNSTDENGTFNLLYPLPDLPLGIYDINMYANQTGFGTAYANQSFSVISNISVSQVDTDIKVVQGESADFNITFASTRNNASMVFFNGTDADLNVSAYTFLLLNNTATEVTTNFTATVDAQIGIHTVTFTLVNNSDTLFKFALQIEVLPAVSLEVIEYAKNIVAGIDGEMFVVLQNARPFAQEAVNISLGGPNIQAFTKNISLQGGERVSIYFPLIFTGSFNIGSINFDVNITRMTQVLDFKSYTSTLVPAVEIVSISTSEAIVQGRAYYINFHAVNNINVTQWVDLYINGKLIKEDIPLQPGDNYKIEAQDPLTTNPWDFTTYTLDVTFKYNDIDIFQDRLLIRTVVSVENVLFFYVLPIVLPIAIVLIFYQRQKKRELLR